MEAVVLHRVGFLAYFCPKQGQDFKPSAAPLYPNMGQVPPPPPRACKETLNALLLSLGKEKQTYQMNREEKELDPLVLNIALASFSLILIQLYIEDWFFFPFAWEAFLCREPGYYTKRHDPTKV